MKNLKIIFTVLLLTIGSVSFANNCGELDSESFRFDNDSYLTTFAINLNDGRDKVYVTNVNSPRLHRDVLNRFSDRSFDDRFELGLFACLDAYKTKSRTLSSGEVRTYASTEKHRLWENGELVSQFPAAENLNDLADSIGEYFDVSKISQYGYTYELVLDKVSNPEVFRVARDLFRKRSDYLSPQGKAHDFEVFAVYSDDLNNLVGYIIAIHDDIDHPLWDGSGVTLYLDVNFDVTKRVEWEG